jgi:chromate transporter
MSDNPVSPQVPPAPPQALELLVGFAGVALMAFGGVLPWARRMIVEQRRWMSADEFNELFALSQFLPGPNILNFSVMFGGRCAGPKGAFAALAGVIGPPVVIVIALGAVYAQFSTVDAVRRVLAGLAAAAAGLIIAVSLKMAEPVFKLRTGPAPLVALAIFAAVGLFRLPLLWVLLVAMPLSLGLAWSWRE